MQRIAMIDIGSNSARLVINRIHSAKSYSMIYSQKETLRLSQKIDDKGNLTNEGIKAAVSTLNNFAHMYKLFKVDKTLAVCTAAIRNANNSAAVLAELQQQTKVPVKVISGEQEARYSFWGAINSLDVEDGLFFDLGGGSTELILVRNREIVFSVSLPIGTVNMTDKFDNAEKNFDQDTAYKKMYDFIAEKMQDLPWIKSVELPLIGIGGTARTVAKILQKRKSYNYYKIHNYQFDNNDFEAFFNELKKVPRMQRNRIPGLGNERADIIMAGASIIQALFKVSGSHKFITSGHGVRDGLFYECYFSHLGIQDNVLPDVLQHSINVVQDLCHMDLDHSERVSRFAGKLFDTCFTLHKLPKEYKKILYVASQLHDIGTSINFFNHEQHSAYLIESMQLFGLTHFEQVMAAVVACWHNGVSQNYFKYHVYNQLLQPKDWVAAKKLALLLSMAEVLDYTETGAIKDIAISFSKSNFVLLLVEPSEVGKKPSVEIAQVRSKGNWFRKELGMELVVGLK